MILLFAASLVLSVLLLSVGSLHVTEFTTSSGIESLYARAGLGI